VRQTQFMHIRGAINFEPLIYQ